MTERYIVTLEGRRVGLKEGWPSLRDVFTSHCRTPMFAGHTALFYSVGHHCLSAAHLAATEIVEVTGEGIEVALCSLLHEAESAVFGDVPGPVKCHPQRLAEQDVRARFYLSLGVSFSPAVWARMERFDKIEQAASATWLGLAESVHSAVWDACSETMKAKAITQTKINYQKFPPSHQLNPDSDLMLALTELYSMWR